MNSSNLEIRRVINVRLRCYESDHTQYNINRTRSEKRIRRVAGEELGSSKTQTIVEDMRWSDTHARLAVNILVYIYVYISN